MIYVVSLCIQLGYGDKDNRGVCGSSWDLSTLTDVDMGTDFEIAEIMIMSHYGCALSTDDQLKCWGKQSVSVYNVHIVSVSLSVHDLVHIHTVHLYTGLNNYGQLGMDDTENRGDDATEMGDDLPVVSIPFYNTTSTCSPTADPTTEPTVEPTIPTMEPTVPSAVPSIEPTIPPTRYPGISPFGTAKPTVDPTTAPTFLPSVDPTAPTSSPSEQPSISPTLPTAEPSQLPTHSPTVSPLTLQQILKFEVDDKWKFDELSEYICIGIIGLGVIVVLVAILIGNKRRKKEEKYHVEGQGYLSVILFVTQIIDVISDILFFIQMRRYYVYGQTDNDVNHEVFAQLSSISFIFVVVPYILNITSSVRVVQRITDGDSISEFSKKYFQKHSKMYSVLTMMSGGAFHALQLMNSKFLSIPLFNAGLSDLQIERFRTHHVLSTLIMENIPQLALQGFVIFKLRISGTIVIMSFVSSVFNVMMNILTAAVYIVLHRNESELKFNILVSWSGKLQNVSSTEYAHSAIQSVDPFLRTGRRVSLAKKLALINYGGSKTVRFEIMAAKKQIDSYTLYGVMQFDEGSESAAALLANFMEKVDDILDAIISAFGYYPDFTDHLDFQIEVSQSETSSRADKVKLVSDLLTELGVDEEKLQQSLSWIPMEVLCPFSLCVFLYSARYAVVIR